MSEPTTNGLVPTFFRAVRGDCSMRKTLWLGLFAGSAVWSMLFIVIGYVFRSTPTGGLMEKVAGGALLGSAALLYFWAFLLTIGVIRSSLKTEPTARKVEGLLCLLIFWFILLTLFAGFIHIVMFI